MKHQLFLTICCTMSLVFTSCNNRQTTVSIEGEKILINGEYTLKGVSWEGINMEGLLPNARMVQGIFDDLNSETVDRWRYPDTERWDPERNTNEFVAAMPSWREHGLLAFTINLQGGSPTGYSRHQPWHNSAIDSLGNLRPAYMARLEKIMDKSDELGMVTILGIFYFGQDQRLKDNEAVKNAVINTVNWLHHKKYRNVLIEIANECDASSYEHDLIRAEKAHELIELVQSMTKNGHTYPVSTSFLGNRLATDNVIEAADFIIIHGNGVHYPERITEMVKLTRESKNYNPKPIIFNEDDHYDFYKENYNMKAAFEAGASWGYFDYRHDGEPHEAGYQSVPADWRINHIRKQEFFGLLKEITSTK